MPGQIPLDTKYYPSDFNVVADVIVVPSSGVTAVPLLYADRTLVIDSVTLYVVPGVAIATNTLPLKIKQVSGGVSPTFGTTTQDVGSFTALPVGTTQAATAFQTLTFAVTSPNTSPNNNVVPAGSVVWFQTNAAGSITNTPTVMVQVRYRSQI